MWRTSSRWPGLHDMTETGVKVEGEGIAFARDSPSYYESQSVYLSVCPRPDTAHVPPNVCSSGITHPGGPGSALQNPQTVHICRATKRQHPPASQVGDAHDPSSDLPGFQRCCHPITVRPLITQADLGGRESGFPPHLNLGAIMYQGPSDSVVVPALPFYCWIPFYPKPHAPRELIRSSCPYHPEHPISPFPQTLAAAV